MLTLGAQKADLYVEYPATLEGIQTVEIRSKIDGYIEEVFVEEGSLVKIGQKLFKIDANRFVQDVNQRKAAVLAVEAALETASIQVLRTQALVDKKIVNSFELTTARNVERVKKAELNQAKAALSDAQSQLAFTQIVSPIMGIVGRLPLKKVA
ncbi:efflux RND transporter periplasmic adaptor subunit [Sphingobacterium sp. KU25419]|nr:efflux RND transporter periplasmic adaptor subunit [Sphingobacterium sp. KU25419]